jgi:uncharacterized protein
MTRTTMGSLWELQKIDTEIREIREGIQAFEPRLAEVEEPALELESELARSRERLEQMRVDARRLERSAEDKRARAGRLDERLNRVSNLREEAAVRTELDMVRRAIDADEHEALQLLEQVRRAELALEELEARTTEARGAVEPSQRALLDERRGLDERLEELTARREGVLETLGAPERRVYDSFHASGRRTVVAGLTEDGACGACFGVVPLQLRHEIRRGRELVRCEACGVILTSEGDPGGS